MGPPANKSDKDAERQERLNWLIHHEYQYLTEQLVRNEEMGEKRVGLFVTLTSGLGAAAVLAREKLTSASPVDFPEISIAVNAAWLVLGYVTFLRILHRNAATDDLKLQLRRIRKWFVEEGDDSARSFFRMTLTGQRLLERH